VAFEAEVEPGNATVHAHEREHETPLLGGPTSDIRVEPARLRPRHDRRAALVLPAGALDGETVLEQLLEPLAGRAEIHPNPSLGLEPAAAAAQLSQGLASDPAPVVLPVALDLYVPRTLDRADQHEPARGLRRIAEGAEVV